MMDASRLGFDPLIPWIALFVLAGGAFALWGAYVVYRGKAWLFRALALTVLTLALANPLWIEEQREPLKDVVAVIMDRSESMNFRGRTETAQAAYEGLRRDLEADENLELRIAETDPGADGTDMYIALQSALSDVPRDRIAGAVMITDGQIHDIPEDTSDAVQLGPVHAMIVGGDDEIDRNIEIQSVPSFSIIDQRVEMRVRVNDPTAETVEVGVTINGEQQPSQTIRVGKGRVASVMSDQLWLWARGYEGGGPYAELIRRTAHWLMKEPELEEELLTLEAGASSEVKARLQTLSDSPPPLKMLGPDGVEVETPWTLVSPGIYQAATPASELGLYRATSGKLNAVTLRGPTHPREYLDLRATTEKVQPLANATLGGVYRLGADGTPNMPRLQRVGERGPAAAADWSGLRRRDAYADRATESTTLLPGVVGMLLACAFMMLAWRREGR